MSILVMRCFPICRMMLGPTPTALAYYQPQMSSADRGSLRGAEMLVRVRLRRLKIAAIRPGLRWFVVLFGAQPTSGILSGLPHAHVL
jgi:hypothetical protein